MTVQYLIAFPTGPVSFVNTGTVPCEPLNGQPQPQPQPWAWHMVGTQEIVVEYKNEQKNGDSETSGGKAVLSGPRWKSPAKDGWMGIGR